MASHYSPFCIYLVLVRVRSLLRSGNELVVVRFNLVSAQVKRMQEMGKQRTRNTIRLLWHYACLVRLFEIYLTGGRFVEFAWISRIQPNNYDIHNNFRFHSVGIYWRVAPASIFICFSVERISDSRQVGANCDWYLFTDLSIGCFPGANDWGTGKYMADITSYDYDAVMTEAGDPNGLKYTKVKEVIEQHFKLPVGAVPATKRKMTLPSVELYAKIKLLSADGRKSLGTNGRRSSSNPLSFEQLRQYSGLVLYEATLPKIEINPTLLTVNGLHDRAYVLLDEALVGILSRENNISSLPINGVRGQKLQILVENQGRINFNVFDDFKVLVVMVTRHSETK